MMKTNFKHIVSLICALAMILSLCSPAFATTEGLVFDMEALGITSGMNAQERAGEYVRRDEFAQMVVNMIMQQDVAKSLENQVYFSDVAQSPYKGAVNLLANLKYVSGDGTGSFNPDQYISYGAACKILVCALGYEPVVREKTLMGYMGIAASIGVTKNIVSTDEFLTFEKAMMMIDNALDIGMMVPQYYNDNIAPSYEIDEDRTYRSLLNGRNGNGVVKLHGVVTADVTTYLYGSYPKLKDTQIVIEDKVYDFDGIAPTGYVGQTVEYYVSTNDFEENEVVALSPTNKNTVNDFMGSQIDKLSKEQVVFIDDELGKVTVKTDYETRFIYNNRIDLKYSLTNIEKTDSFVVRTVDNDGDNISDVIFVYEYTDCIAESVYTDTGVITLKNGYGLDGARTITLDEEKISFEIFDYLGRAKTIEDIVKDEVLSVAVSKDGSMVRIVKGMEPVRGVVLSRDGEYIFVDNTEYYCDKRVIAADLSLGTEIIGYLNFAGILVDFEKVQSEHTYGYVYTYGTKTSSFGNYYVKMLMPEYISVKQVEGEVDELSGEVALSNSLFVRNRSVVVFDVESKIMFDGKKVSAKTALEKVVDTPVSYKIGTNGKLVGIETISAVDDVKIKAADDAKECVSLNNKKYNGTEQIFGGGKGNPFAIREDYTLAFCVPMYKQQKKADVSDEDLLVFAELLNGVGYEANGYEQDEDSFVADVLVVQKAMNSNQTIDVTQTSDVGLVTKISHVLEEETGAELAAITMLTDGAERKFVVAEQRMNQGSLKNIAAGDLVAYTLDGFDKINTISVLQKYNNYNDFDESEIGKVCATVQDLKAMNISNVKIRWVNILEVGNGKDISYKYELLVRNPSPVFIIEGKTYRTGSFDDISIGDRVLVVQDVETTNIRAVVVNR